MEVVADVPADQTHGNLRHRGIQTGQGHPEAPTIPHRLHRSAAQTPDGPLPRHTGRGPLQPQRVLYEFKIEDIDFVEQLPSLVNMEEDVIPIMRIWVKKQSVGLRCTPFMVADTMMEIKP